MRRAPVKCLECRETFTPRQYSTAFCCTACRRSFNNRRAMRGALLYDLTMLADTPSDAKHNWRATIEALKAKWAKEDAEAGRTRTWNSAEEVAMNTRLLRVERLA